MMDIMSLPPKSDDDRLRRQDRFVIYSDARDILVGILAREPLDLILTADDVLVLIDQSWRAAERFASAELRKRRDDPAWPVFKARLSDHERRARAVFDRFDRRKRDLGAPVAAVVAARLWIGKLQYARRHDRAAVLPVLWEQAVAGALIGTLERSFGRRLHLDGPDVRLLVTLFDAACADRRKRGLPISLLRGKGARQPGTASWFRHVLRYRRCVPADD